MRCSPDEDHPAAPGGQPIRPRGSGLRLIWLSGRTLELARQVRDPLDRAKLSHVGAGVAMSALASATSWAVSSLWITGGGTPVVRAVAAAFAGVAGAILVAGFDRPALFAADVASGSCWARTFRWPLIVLIALLASLKTTTFFLPGDLAQSAAMERQERVLDRAERTARAFDLSRLEGRGVQLDRETGRLEAAARTLPPSISDDLAGARACAIAVSRRRRAIVAAGVPRRETVRLTADAARACEAARRAAERMRAEYLRDAAADLARARAAGDAQAATLAEARAEADALRKAGAATDATITDDSVTAIWRLLATNKLAWVYFGALWGLWMLWDGWGLIVGAQQGRTVQGRRLQTEHENAVSREDERLIRLAGRIDHVRAVEEAFATARRREGPQETFVQAASRSMARAAPITSAAITAESIGDDLARVGMAKATAEGHAAGAAEIIGRVVDEALATSRGDLEDA